MKPILLTVPQVQRLLQISRSGVYRLLQRNVIEGVKIGRGLRISRRSLEQFIEKQLEQYQEENGLSEVPE